MKLRVKPGYGWPAFLVGLLVANAAGVVVLIIVSSSSSGHAVEPDYYNKALRWDGAMAQQRANQQLGWRAELSFDALPGSSSRARIPPTQLVLRLRDRTGQAVRGARVSTEAFARLRAGRRYQVALRDMGDGRYGGPLRLWPRGIWHFRTTAIQGTKRFTAELVQDAPPLLP